MPAKGAASGVGPANGAPDLPDAVPSGVQDLLNGVFGGIGAAGRAFGEAVSGLASAINGGDAAVMLPPGTSAVLLDSVGVLA